MSFLSRQENIRNNLYYYRVPEISNVDTAIAFLLRTVSMEHFLPQLIVLTDLKHSADEGNDSCTMEIKEMTTSLAQVLRLKNIDSVCIEGSFRGKKTIIGVDLGNYLVKILVKKRDNVDLQEIESLLKLNQA